MKPDLPAAIDYTTITSLEGMRAGFAANECGEFDHPEDLLDFERALNAIGVAPRRLGYGTRLVQELLDRRPALLWNLNSGLIGEAREAQVPSLCEMLGIALVGPGAWNAALTQDKSLCALWIQHKIPGLAIPHGIHVSVECDLQASLSRLPWPDTYIIKPNNEDSSRGLDAGCVRSTRSGVAEQAGRILQDWGTVRIEQFISGYDISANLACTSDGALVALEPLALLTERGVYDEESRLAGAYRRITVKSMDEVLARRVMGLALAVGRACRFREYARLDMRVNPASGELYFLEANITPSFNLDGDYVQSAAASGLSFEALLRNIVTSAWRRAHGEASGASRPARIRSYDGLW